MRGDIRCIEGRSFRHDPQHDDPELETDIGRCAECEGKGCRELFIAQAEAKIGDKIKTHFEYPPIWLVPGTDPEDDAYGRDYPEQDIADENEGDEADETLEYMVDLLGAGEIDPSEFCRQLLSVGYHPDTISEAIASAA